MSCNVGEAGSSRQVLMDTSFHRCILCSETKYNSVMCSV